MTIRPQQSFRRRITALFLAVWFVFLSLGAPRVAFAMPVEVTTDIPRDTAARVEAAFRDSWGFQAQVALINAMQFFGERLAYETAVWVASGGKAQSQLFDRRSWDTFLADSLFGAGLNFINDMDTFASGQWGFDTPFGVAQFICSPSLPELRLSLKLGLQDRLKPRQPLCTFSQFRDNWDAFTSEENLAKSLSGIGIAFEPGESDLSAGLELHAGIGGQIADKQLANIGKRLQDGGYLPTEESISGATKTPASVGKEALIQDVVKQRKEGVVKTGTELSAAVRSQETFVPMLKAMAEALAINFAVTLASQTLQQQVLNKGLFVGDLIGGPDRNLAGGNATAGPPAAGRKGAEAVFAEFVRPRVVTSGDYDQLTQFASCDPQNRQITSCVIDDGFTQAVRRSQTGQAMTVNEALEATFLHGNWAFIPSGTGEDQDPNCYQDAYCGSNLTKLRQARIIPIGWELTANHPSNVNPNDRLTLGEVVAAFHANGNDGRCGTADAGESPLCGLIDPDWVLRYPDQQCRMRGPGELLIQANANVRAEQCSDSPSCLETDAEGKCVGGYGYCLAERNIWHISGRSCPASAVSCRALVNRQGEELAVLTSTVDRAQCNAENVGCRWYSTTRNTSGTWLGTAGNRRYFNRNIEQCQASAEGCTELLATATAGRNLVGNASFEEWTLPTPPVGWSFAPITPTRVESPTQHGTVAAQVSVIAGMNARLSQDITVAQRGSYTVSAAFRIPAGGAAVSPSVEILQGTTAVCAATATSPPLDAWFQPSTTCALEPGTYTVLTRIVGTTGPSTVFVDSVQVELGTSVTAFHEGYRPDAPRTYLRAAPDDLRCYDLRGDGTLNTDNDPADGSCSQFARGCTEAEVGCERYTPADGTPAVNGQANDIDRCPQECAGYGAFREVESNFDRRSEFDFFIPSTARQCTAEEAGCSEFTNLDALERGGEQRSYFSFLRRCEKPNTATVSTATYYTWEGSDQQGFQLRSFILQSSSSDVNSAPKVFGSAPADCSGSMDPFVRADCRAFYSQNGTIHRRQLSRTTLITDDCVRYRPSHQIPTTGTFCADLGGAVTGGACVIKGYRQESTQCSAAAMGCRAYRGNASGVVQTLLDSSFETLGVSALEGWSVGAQSSEALTVGQHSLQLAGAGAATVHPLTTTLTGLTSAQCTERGGTFTAGVAGVADTCLAPTVTRGHTYELLIIGKGSGRLAVTLPQTGGTLTDVASYSVTLGPTWQLLRVGPLIVEQQPSSTAQLRLAVMSGGATFIDQVILREVPQLTTVVKGSWQTPQQCDRVSIAQDAPPLAQGMLGCRAYRPRSGPPVNLRSFSRLCSEAVVGCTAFHDTQNSASLGAEPFNTSDPPTIDDITVPADALRYLVNDPTKSCAATAKGCARFGKPTIDRSGTDAAGQTSGWSDAYLLDHPDRYTGAGALLCQDSQLFCDEYRGRDGALIYFKDPVNRKCQYKEDVTPITLRTITTAAACTTRGGTFVAGTGGAPGTCTVSGIPTTGWFQGDTSTPCYENLIIEGARYGIRANADIDNPTTASINEAYQGWAGLCEPTQDQCVELRDPTDVSRQFPTGHLYSVLHDDQLDLASCAGNVSRKSGCAMLDASLNPSKIWNAAVTYVESDRQSGALVAPVDCDRNPTACRRCVVERACRNTSGGVQPKSCTIDSNCASGFTCQGTAPNKVCRTPAPAAAPQVVPCTADANCLGGLGFRCSGGEIGPTCGTASLPGVDQDNVCDGFVQDSSVCRQLQNDSNLIAKVKRDRACAQWVEKDGCYDAWVPDEGRVVQACTGLRRTGNADAPGAPASSMITLASYRSRPQSWVSADASGLTAPRQASVDGLEQVSAGYCALAPAIGCAPGAEDACLASQGWGGPSQCVPIRRLAFVHCPRGTSGCSASLEGACADSAAAGVPCGPALSEFGGAQGICVGGRCAYGVTPPADPSNGHPNRNVRIGTWPMPICKVYPENDAPFPSSVVGSDEVPLPGFSRANVCEDGTCACAYQKVQYGDSITKYFTLTNSTLPTGYCVGGDHDGEDCDSAQIGVRTATNKSCNAAEGSAVVIDPNLANRNGRCVPQKRRQVFHGIEGYCLEEDRSMIKNGDQTENACLSFLPIDQLQGSFDTNSQFQSAGFQLQDNQEWYCAGKREGAGRAPLSFRMRRTAAALNNLIVIDGMVGGTYASDAAQLFGPPQDPPPGYQSHVLERSTGPVSPIGPRDADWHDNCENTDREAWCGLPSKLKPEFTFCSGNPGGCRYEMSEDSNFYEGQYNFFGCYEFADDHVNTVYYPWADTSKKIYRWQLAEMNITLLHGDTPDRCLQFTYDRSESYGTRPASIPLERSTENSYDAASGSYALYVDVPGAGDFAGSLSFHAFFNSQDQFMGIVIEVADPDDEGSMFISGLEFVYKEGCDRIAKVTNGTGGRTYSFTDKTGDWSGSGSVGAYERGTERTPWGGIVEDGSALLSGTTRPYIPETSNGATPNENYAAALYSWGSQELRRLFAKVTEVRAVPDVDVGGAGGAGSCTSGEKFGQSCTTNASCRYPIPASSLVGCLSQTVWTCRGGMVPSGPGDGGACPASGCTNGRVCLNVTTGATCAGGAGCACRRSAAGRPCTLLTGSAICGTGGMCEDKVCVIGESASAAAQTFNGRGCGNDADCSGVAGACQTQTEDLCEPVDGVPPGVHCTPGNAEVDCRSSTTSPPLCAPYTPVPTAGISSIPIPLTYGPSRSTETWDIRPEVGQPPVVFGVGSCDPSNGNCEEGGSRLDHTVTVSGQSGGDVVGVGGLMSADMKFFYRANENQMPVRRVIVQWGDGLASYDPGTEATNSFPNRRGMRDNDGAAGVGATSECNNSSFGTAPTIACIERPFSMTHVYTCGGQGSLPVCTGAGGTRPGSSQEAATGCYDGSFTGPSGQSGACVYIPRVHIKDNWGFCTGRCPNSGAYVTRADAEKCFDGTGFAAAGTPLATDECSENSAKPWTYFQGRVIVGPP